MIRNDTLQAPLGRGASFLVEQNGCSEGGRAIQACDQGRQNLQLTGGGSCVATVSMFRYISRRWVKRGIRARCMHY
ncbi:hypothetical protein HBI81_246070 [Parastagonospora nodorum]|nr:hypothetical protein HBH52_074180 [Parastagonospora nodorum]KAH5728847.1 hypothetical protein HBI17_225560 [Parastagonospora nodorum]KAH6511066.1 hypothetical protein HBI81_246070 [Parastagonospora nodorum]